jgi:outer membrane protein
MKQFKLVMVAVALFLTAGYTQAQEIAHINVSELVQAMPAMKSAQAELKKLSETYDKDIKAKYAALQAKVQRYNTESATVSAEVNNTRRQEVQAEEQGIQQYAQSAQSELGKKQQALLSAIEADVKKAIEAVAAAKGYKYVFDATPGASLLVAKGKNIMSEVKAKLGI